MLIKRILAYIFFAIGLLSVTFFRAYHGSILPYPWLFWLIGAATFVTGWLVLRYTPTVKEEHDNDAKKDRIRLLKENGEKIRVRFADCTIKSNDFMQEQELFSDDVPDVTVETEAWDSPTSTKVVEVNESVVVYAHKGAKGEEIFMSEIVLKDPATLMFMLDEQKESIVYVDSKNRENYYFDLSFLDEKETAV